MDHSVPFLSDGRDKDVEFGASSSPAASASSRLDPNMTLEGLSRQVNQDRQLEISELQRKDQELEQLRRKLQEQQDLQIQKDSYIRRLEQERYRKQEEQALQIRRIYQRQNNGYDISRNGNNPYSDHTGNGVYRGCQVLLSLVVGILTASVPACARRRTRSQSADVLSILHGAAFFILAINFLRFLKAIHVAPSSAESIMYDTNYYPQEPKPHLKPWESTLPSPIPLHSSHQDFVKQRHMCIQEIRKRHVDVLGKLLDEIPTTEPILLVDPAYHSNVGGTLLPFDV